MKADINKNFFATQIGSILATAGSAVGLGNIWRFPTVTGQNGGAAFILIYLFFNLILGVTCMMAEFIVGRNGASNPMRAYIKAGKKKSWGVMGILAILCGSLILSFYSVVAGWCVYYLYLAITGGVLGSFDQIQSTFSALVGEKDIYICCTISVLFVVITHLIVVQGVQKGIERSAKYMVPMLILLLIALGMASTSLPGAWRGLEFLFKPDFSKVTVHTLYEAMSMAFFSLSLGTACLVTYASYFREDANIGKFALQISIIDVVVAILAGITIFPAAFSVGVEPDAGPSLIFLTIPNVFTQAFSPTSGYYLSILFYFLLVLAALTSTISMHEIGTSLLSQEMKTSRTVAGTVITLFCCVMGTLCAMSFSHPDIGVLGGTLFDNLDSVTSKVFMPIGTFATCLLVGWIMSRRTVLRQLTSNSLYPLPRTAIRLFFILVKFVCPILTAIIFVVSIFFTN